MTKKQLIHLGLSSLGMLVFSPKAPKVLLNQELNAQCMGMGYPLAVFSCTVDGQYTCAQVRCTAGTCCGQCVM